MTLPGSFSQMEVRPMNHTNGIINDYHITFIADIPLSSGDIFYLVFPTTITTPKEPTCKKVSCLQSADCTSEQGRIVVTLTGPCTHAGASIKFYIKDIQNAPSQVKSTNF